MKKMYTIDEIYRLGMDCLVREFGIVNTELFINAIMLKAGDYTEERREIFKDLTHDELFAGMLECGRKHEQAE